MAVWGGRSGGKKQSENREMTVGVRLAAPANRIERTDFAFVIVTIDKVIALFLSLIFFLLFTLLYVT